MAVSIRDLFSGLSNSAKASRNAVLASSRVSIFIGGGAAIFVGKGAGYKGSKCRTPPKKRPLWPFNHGIGVIAVGKQCKLQKWAESSVDKWRTRRLSWLALPGERLTVAGHVSCESDTIKVWKRFENAWEAGRIPEAGCSSSWMFEFLARPQQEAEFQAARQRQRRLQTYTKELEILSTAPAQNLDAIQKWVCWVAGAWVCAIGFRRHVWLQTAAATCRSHHSAGI
jgi:hypothetical protein